MVEDVERRRIEDEDGSRRDTGESMKKIYEKDRHRGLPATASSPKAAWLSTVYVVYRLESNGVRE